MTSGQTITKTETLVDEELITRVKELGDEASLAELVKRHSGIYVRMVSSYAPKDTVIDNYYDFLASRETNIYRAALSFDPTRNAKFPTYLGNFTRWLCLRSNRKRRSIPIGDMEPEAYYESSEAQLIEEASLLAAVLGAISEMKDDRVSKIFRLRYATDNEGLKLTPWKEVAKELDLSIQGCINIHNAAIAKLKEQNKP